MNPNRMRGVALITAMLVVAVAVLAATALLASSNLAVRRTAALQDTEQAWWLARGVEAWIVEIIREDDPRYDALDVENAWAQPVDYLPVEQGFLRGRVVDQQGLFNLNNLAPTLPTASKPRQDDVYRRQFERLLEGVARQAGIDGPLPDLVPAIRDWMDAGQIPNFPGVEDLAYLALEPPYRTADRPFVSVSELRAVHGMTAGLYAALTSGCPLADGAPAQPCIAALPLTAAPNQPPTATKVNVNTASRQLLLALSDATDSGALDGFLGERVLKPATDIGQFLSRNVYRNARTEDQADAQCAVTTDFFQIRGEVVVGSSRVPLYSLIARKPQLHIIAHSAAED